MPVAWSRRNKTPYQCSKLASATLPSTLNSIGNYAFYYCSALTDLTISEGVKAIGTYAFYRCTSLTEVRLPSTITSVNNYAFQNCSKLTAAYFYGNAPTAGSYVLDSCPSQLIVYRLADKTGWGSTWGGKTVATFVATSAETSVTYPVEGGELIFDKAVGYVTGYTGSPTVVDIPQQIDGVDVVGLVPELFKQCTTLTSVTLPEGLRSMGDSAFTGCTALTSVKLPGTLTEIGQRAFEGCTVLSNVTLGEGMTNLGVRMFSGCSALTETTIPEGITNIGECAFLGCTGLVSLQLPGTVTACGPDVFSGCTSLKEVTIGEGITTLGQGIFLNCKALEHITLPESLTNIVFYAFSGCTGLTEIVIPEGVTSIGNAAFYGCTKLASVNLPSTLTSFGTYTFQNCTSLTSIEIPEGVTSIGNYAFNGCTRLSSATLPSTLTNIGAYAYQNCTGLTEIIVPEGVTSIGDYAFDGCTKLATAELPSTLTSIGQYAFRNCGLTEIVIPEGVTSIGSDAFYQCSKLASATLPSTLNSIGNYAFYYCSALTDLTISEGVKAIGTYAFYRCTSLTEVRLPSTITSVNNYAFQNCSKLTVAYFYGDAPSVGSYIFSGTSGLTVFYLAGRKNWTVPTWNGYPTKSFTEDSTTRYYPVTGGSISYDTETGAVTGYVGAPTQITVPMTIVGTPITAISDGAFQNCASLTSVCIPNSVTEIGQNAFSANAVLYGGADSAVQAYAAESGLTFVSLGVSSVSPVANSTLGGNASSVSVTMNTQMATPLLLECKDVDGNVCPVGCGVTNQTVSNGKRVYTLSLDLSKLESGMHDFAFYSAEYGFSYHVQYDVDRTPPTPPSGLTVTPSDLQNTVAWQEAAQAKVTSYRLYRAVGLEGAYTLLTTITNRKTLSYVDTNVQSDVEYLYKISAVDKYGMEGEPAGPVTSMPNRDTTPPQITKVSPANGSTLSGTVSLTVNATDNIKVRSIAAAFSKDGENWSDEQTIYTDNQAVFSIDTTAWESALYVRLRCEDIYGNSAEGSTTYRYSIDNVAPEKVSGLSAETAATIITLHWNRPEDGDIAYFVVEKQNEDGSFSNYKQVTTVGANLTGLTPNIAYTFRVYACDTHGNRGLPSEPLTVSTVQDTSVPVITSISPSPGRYNGKIDLTFGISDDYGIASVTVQTSRDNRTWADVATINVSKAEKTVYVNYALSTTNLPDGLVYVRGIATDFDGNRSDFSSRAPFIQYMIDHIPPAVPEGLKAEQISNVVYLTWTQGTETDLAGYTIYRSTSENGTYQQLKTGLTKIAYTDKINLSSGTTYYYKLACRDTTGNISASSAPVSVKYEYTPDPDTTLPRIISVSPSNGYVLGANTAINVKVHDNTIVTNCFYRYSGDDGVWTEWQTIPVNDREDVVALPVNAAEISKDAFAVEVYCEDGSENESTHITRNYTIDTQPPEAPVVTAEGTPMAIEVQWSTANEEDLAGFYLYRRNRAENAYICIAQFSNDGKESYSYTDYQVLPDYSYSYYVTAIDKTGNSSESQKTAGVQPVNEDVEEPVIRVSGNTIGTVGIEMSFSAAKSYDNVGVTSFSWDFGDGGTSNLAEPSHSYDAAGTYTVSLTIADAAGNQSIGDFDVTVKEASQAAKLTVTVRDENGTVLPDAGVYFNFGSSEQNTVYTSSSGTARITAESGSYQVAAYKDGYLPAKGTVRLVENSDASLSLTLVKSAIVTGSLTVTRMTLEEIEAAGIDTANPANQQVYRDTITLTYEGTVVELITETDQYGNPLRDPDSVTVWDRYGNKRLLKAFYPSDSEEDEVSGRRYRKRNIRAVLDMPFEATWTKDFFDVHLYVFNEASEEFVLDDCTAVLNLPSGLTLIATEKSAEEKLVSLGSIPGQSSATADWIIRGDVAGEYNLDVDFRGILRGFNEIVEANFATKEPFRVRNGDNLHLNILTESSIQAYTNGELRIGLRNEDPEPYYGVNFTLENAKLIRKFKTSGGVETEENLTALNHGDVLWSYYEIERDNWDALLKYSDTDFYLVNQICSKLGNTNLQVHFGTFDGDGGEPEKPTDPIAIKPEAITLQIGETAELTVTTSPFVEKYTLTSSNSDIVSVSGNTLIAHKMGKAEITAALEDDPDMKAMCNVIVVRYDDVMCAIAASQLAYEGDLLRYSLYNDATVAKFANTFIEPDQGLWGGNADNVALSKFYFDVLGDWKVIDAISNQSGLIAIALDNEERNQRILAFRGTNSLADVGADLKFAMLNQLPERFADAMLFYSKNTKDGRKILLTGHSLGGAVACYVSLLTGERAELFNSANGLIMEDAYFAGGEDIYQNFHGADRWNFVNHVTDCSIMSVNWPIAFQNAEKLPTEVHKFSNNVTSGSANGITGHNLCSMLEYDESAELFKLTSGTSYSSALPEVRQFEMTDGLAFIENALNFIKTPLWLTALSLALKQYEIASNQDHLKVRFSFGSSGNNKIVDKNLIEQVVLLGGDGNDYLLGGCINDVLVGGNGANLMDGGPMNDLYVITGTDDQIINDCSGSDTIFIPSDVRVSSFISPSDAHDSFFVLALTNGQRIMINKNRKQTATIRVESMDGTYCGTYQAVQEQSRLARAAKKATTLYAEDMDLQAGGHVTTLEFLGKDLVLDVYDQNENLLGTVRTASDAFPRYTPYGYFYYDMQESRLWMHLFDTNGQIRVTSSAQQTVYCTSISHADRDDFPLRSATTEIALQPTDTLLTPSGFMQESVLPFRIEKSDGNIQEVPAKIQNLVETAEHLYTISFDANGGMASTPSMTTNTAGKLTTLPTATRDGYIFDGWFTAMEGGFQVDVNQVYTADTILYAQWTANGSDTPPTQEHTHSWSAAWSSNATHHWHECNTSGCTITSNSAKDGYGEHTSDGGKVTTAATANQNGVRTYSCEVCGYVICTETIPATGGSSGDGTYTPSDTPSTSTTYPPKVEKPSGGGGEAPAISPANPKRGDTVTVTPKPDDGYKVDKVTVTDRSGSAVEVELNSDGTYTFIQPAGTVAIEVTYVPLVDLPGGWKNPFTDVTAGVWYYDAVRFVQERGLMDGYGNGKFGTDDNLSRAQFAQILFNKEGRPVVNYLLRYNDVADGAWYTEAVRWATSQGVVSGYGNGMFGPNDNITREQLAVMLWWYAGSPAATDKELHFTDADKASGYTLEALRWATEEGIINGKGNGILDPKGFATRAEVAQMLKNYLDR